MLRKFWGNNYFLKHIVIFITIFCITVFNSFNILPPLNLQAQSDPFILSEMEDISSWTVFNGCSIGVDTQNKVSGNGSMRITSTVPGGGKDLNIYTTEVFTKDFTDLDNLEVNLYTENIDDIYSIAIFLLTDYSNFYYTYIGKWELMSGWNTIRRTKSDFYAYGNPNWENITKYWVRSEGAQNKNQQFNVDKISYNVQGDTKILLTFDDSWRGVYEYAYPIMKSKNMKGTLWINKSFIEEKDPLFMTKKQITAIYNDGWDVGNHTVNHPDDITALSRDEKIFEYETNRKWIVKNGWSRGSNHVCYPMGSFDDELMSLLKQLNVKSGRTTIHGLQAEPVEDLYRLKCVAVGRDTDMNFIKKMIDNAVITGSNIFFMFHNVDPSPDPNDPEQTIYATLDDFNLILNYLESYRNSSDLDVVTITQWYDNYVAQNF